MVKAWKTIKTKTGKRVKRYVEVLKSGKWKFLKTPKSGRKPRKQKTYKGGSSTVKPRRTRMGRGIGNLTRKFRSILKVVALLTPAVDAALLQGATPQTKLAVFSVRYTGWDPRDKRFHFGRLAEGWMPYLAVNAIDAGISIMLRLARSIGK